MKPSSINSLVTAMLATTLLAGCLPSPDDEGDVYRAALPVKEAVTLDGPESSGAGRGNRTSTDSTAAPANAPSSKYYAFTREVRDGVNRVTASVLGTVWFIVNTKPTKIVDNEATWGPYTDALEPATWRFRVTRVAGASFVYVLEGRPKDSSATADYRTVLEGTGFGRDDPRHGDGTFNLDLDTAKELDPFAHADDSGTITITHDLPPTSTREFAPLPRRIEVSLAPSSSAARLEVLSVARDDNTGLLLVDGTADIDESHATALEDLTIASQWSAVGTGRADVTIASGDVPAALSPFVVVECWDQKFRQSYYHDSADIEPTAGNPAACAFDSAARSE
jgi:hypothetical protein